MSQKSLIQTLAEDSGLTTRSYSGRGMFGKDCLGVVIDSDIGNFISSILESLTDTVITDMCEYNAAISNLSADFQNMRTDSLGLSTIIYFPKIQFVER